MPEKVHQWSYSFFDQSAPFVSKKQKPVQTTCHSTSFISRHLFLLFTKKMSILHLSQFPAEKRLGEARQKTEGILHNCQKSIEPVKNYWLLTDLLAIGFVIDPHLLRAGGLFSSSFGMFAKGCAKWILVYLDLPGRSKGWSTMALWVGLRKQPELPEYSFQQWILPDSIRSGSISFGLVGSGSEKENTDQFWLFYT
jgi:hypothetical protein